MNRWIPVLTIYPSMCLAIALTPPVTPSLCVSHKLENKVSGKKRENVGEE